MENKENDYIVIAISNEKDAEIAFLEKAGRVNDEAWCYAAMGTNCSKTISKPNDPEINNKVCYSFYLINAYCWKCHVTHVKCACVNKNRPSEKIKKLLKNIKKGRKKIVVWTHNTNNISCNEIKKLFDEKLSFCDSFSHETPNHIVEYFMLNVCENGQDNFKEEFEKLIEASLKKKPNPHLIALSILSQGYLAAHGGKGLDGWNKVPQDIKNKAVGKLKDSDDKKNPTKKAWWTSALGENDPSKIIEDELKAVPDDESIKKEDVLKLIDAIYKNGDTLSDGTLVANAYSALKLILRGKQRVVYDSERD